jgi:hypothetical protein
MGGHRRYTEYEAERLQHQMNFPLEKGFFSEVTDAWHRKSKFISWKKFVASHDSEEKNKLGKCQGSKMALLALEKLADADWESIDKIDEALEPIYDWYRQNREYYWETFCIGLPMTPERQNVGYQLDGIYQTLWGMLGIASNGEKSVLEGNGSFPHERDRIKLAIKNGWDGKGSIHDWQQKRLFERIKQYGEQN